VFTRTDGVWSQQGSKLVGNCFTTCSGASGTGESGSGDFGWSVALSADGTTALIGAFLDGNDPGAAWVFVRSGNSWSQQGPKLVGDCTSACGGPNGTGQILGAYFGYSVALSADGSTALIGDFYDSNGLGAAWVFTRSAGAWSQQGSKLVGDCTSSCTGPNGTGETGSGGLGFSVALSADGNTALIGAGDDGGGDGSAYIFTRANGTTWSQQGSKLVADCQSSCTGPGGTGESGPGGFGYFGALSADGNTTLIGAPGDNGDAGAAWVFTRANGTTWSQQGPKLLAEVS
jgi:hypothetical protein